MEPGDELADPTTKPEPLRKLFGAICVGLSVTRIL